MDLSDVQVVKDNLATLLDTFFRKMYPSSRIVRHLLLTSMSNHRSFASWRLTLSRSNSRSAGRLFLTESM